MLAHRKGKSLSLSSSSSNSKVGREEFPGSGGSSLAKKGSPAGSGAGVGAAAYKREEKGDAGKKRRAPSFGGKAAAEMAAAAATAATSQVPDANEELLSSATIFSPDASLMQRTRDLKRVLNSLADWDAINDKALLKLIQTLIQNVEHLDERMAPLVVQTLDGNWTLRSAKVVSAFEEFMSELVVIRPCYSGLVLQSLIRKFLPLGVGFGDEGKDEQVCEIVHRNLQRLLEAFPIPRMRESCVKTMGVTYPYMGKPAYVHYCYVKNLIATMSYAPKLALQIIHLCVHKLCRIDVNVPREDVEFFSEIITSEFEVKSEVKGENGDSSVSVELNSHKVINEIICRRQEEINPLVNVVDLCMSLVFECIENLLNSQEAEDAQEGIFGELLKSFETEILPTFGVNHVQFLYFQLICNRPNFCKNFLEFLWKKVINVNTPAVIRMQCMAFIGGVLTRSSAVSVKILKRWLSKMAVWANAYVDQKVKSSHWSSVNVQMHGPFYAVCQTIFYVFAFRNKDLVGLGNRKCTAFTSTLNLGRLVTCDLNPLKAAIPPVAVAFVKAAHVHQISYCQTVLERNQRATIPTSVRDSLSVTAMDSVGPVSNVLESFFPFDPFLLPRSRKWIDPNFRTYEPYLPEVKIEKTESPSRSERFSDENEDSIDMELSSSFQDRSCSHFMDRLLNSSDQRDDLEAAMDEC